MQLHRGSRRWYMTCAECFKQADQQPAEHCAGQHTDTAGTAEAMVFMPTVKPALMSMD